jgi:hypothetical protein
MARVTLGVRRSSTALLALREGEGHGGSAGRCLRPGEQPAAVRLLIPAADTLVADLAERFEVTVTRAPAAPRRISKVQPIETIQLSPPHTDQAPLTITTTSFPGPSLDVGAGQHLALPACGCDACDEQVQNLVEDLVKYCKAVAEGRLSERIDVLRGVLEHAWDGDDWSSCGTRTLTKRRVSELRAGAVQPPPDGHWRPWPRRGSTGDR